MTDKHDWKETDDLLAQLREKIKEDIAAPADPALEEPRPTPEMRAVDTARAEDASIAQEATPVSEEATPTDRTETPVKRVRVKKPAEAVAPSMESGEEVILPPEKRKKPRKKKQPEPENEELAWADRTPASSSAPSDRAGANAKAPLAEGEPVSAPAAPTKQDTPAERGEQTAQEPLEEPILPRRRTTRSTPRRVNTRVLNSHRNATAEDIADLTVESLADDIFGSARQNTEAGRQDEEPPEAPRGVQSGAVPATAPSLTEQARADAEEERLAPGAPATVTATKDGQISFLLPGVGRVEDEQEPFDERKLFSAFAIGQGQKTGHRRSGTSREDKEELKRSVESSEEDFQLLLDLDYEDELGNAIGFEKIREYRELGVNGTTQKKRKRRHVALGEFEAPGQDVYFSKRYAKQKKGYVLRFTLSVLLFFVIFIYEHPAWVPGIFKGPVDGANFPRSYIMIGIQLLLLAAALTYRRLWAGLAAVFKLSPINDSLCSVAALVTLVYHIMLLFLPATGTAPVLYLSPSAMGMALLSLSNLLDWYRKCRTFRVVCSRRQKYALIPRVSVGGNRNNARARILEEEQDEQLLYARPVGFVRNYFSNTDKRGEHDHLFGFQLLLLLAVGAVCGLFRYSAGADGAEIFQVVLVTLLYCFPAVTLLVTSLPMFLGAVLRLGKEGAIVGEEPVYSCGERTTLVLPDSEVFDPMIHEQFELVEDCDIQGTLILVRAMLDRIESPLAPSVDVDMELRLSPEQVELLEIAQDGVSALIGEKRHPVLFGSVAYLQANGVAVKPRADEEGNEIYKRMLLVSVSGKVSAIFLAKYRFSDKMQEFLAGFRGEDVQLMVRTKDPGVHNDLFETLQPDEKDPIRVMKPTATEVDIRTNRVDATIVALGSCREACKVFLDCRRIRRARRFGKLLHVLSMLFGGVIAVLAAVWKPAWLYNPANITLYLLLWCLVHLGFSYFYLRRRE